MQKDAGFRFGIEAEYLLVDARTFRPLGCRELAFHALNDLLETIAVDDLPAVDGLLPQPPHRRVMPYVVEGYHLPDPCAADPELVPKGIEIRTPVRRTIGEAVAILGELHARLQRRLLDYGWTAVALSHHPYDDHFEGPQGQRSESAWRWAMEAMMTFGPDVNVSLPPRLHDRLDTADLFAKIDHYAPAMTLLSLASPLHRGGLWRPDGRVGKSLRTHRRSAVGQALELHAEQPGRLEFKCFEMTASAADFRAYLALWLAVLLDESLRGRGDEASRKRELQRAAVEGLEFAALRERAEELLDRAEAALDAHGFDPADLAPLVDRLRRRRLPADDIIEWFERSGSVEDVLRWLASLASSDADRHASGTEQGMNLQEMRDAGPSDLTAEESGVARHLRLRHADLLPGFLGQRQRARRGILHRLLQCALRENLHGLAGRTVDSQESAFLTVQLTDGAVLTAPVVQRFSLNRWDFGSPITVRRDGITTTVDHATQLLDILCLSNEPDKATEAQTTDAETTEAQRIAWRERFRLELDNSTANYALALAGAERRRERLAAEARGCGCRTSLDWVERQMAACDAWSPLVFYEQWVIDGHPLHPGAKLKLGLSVPDVMRYSPEWESRPEVRIVAVRRSHCRIAACGNEGPGEVLAREYPQLRSLVHGHLQRLGLAPHDYEWIPVHPWQCEHTLPGLYGDALRRREIVIVPHASIPTAALMAVRSLAPCGPGSRGKHHLKTAINVQTTGAVRTVSAQAAENGPMLAAVLAEVQRRELLRKNLSAVLRENPEDHVSAGEIAMPGSALLAESPVGGGPIVGELIARFASRRGIADVRAAVVPFLQSYAETTVPGILTLMSRYGIGLEGHLQNCVLVFRDGDPLRMLVRDMGGVRVWPERLQRHGLEVRFLPGSATKAQDAEDLRNKVGYAFLQNHWGELIACLVRTYGIEERACWDPLAAVCSTVFRELATDAATDAASVADVRADEAAFFRPHLALKALATMRLRGDVTKYSFSEVSNPLAEFAGRNL